METIPTHRQTIEETVPNGQSSQAQIVSHSTQVYVRLQDTPELCKTNKLDIAGGHTKWRDKAGLEIAQLAKYDVFTNKGIDGDPGPDFNKIRLHLV
jgi:hypothetical protein